MKEREASLFIVRETLVPLNSSINVRFQVDKIIKNIRMGGSTITDGCKVHKNNRMDAKYVSVKILVYIISVLSFRSFTRESNP